MQDETCVTLLQVANATNTWALHSWSKCCTSSRHAGSRCIQFTITAKRWAPLAPLPNVLLSIQQDVMLKHLRADFALAEVPRWLAVAGCACHQGDVFIWKQWLACSVCCAGIVSLLFRGFCRCAAASSAQMEPCDCSLCLAMGGADSAACPHNGRHLPCCC